MLSAKRLANELKELSENLPEGIISIGPKDHTNLYHWVGSIRGPENTPYEGSKLEIEMNFPQNYPIHPPKLVFKSKIWHPNVYSNGEVCISILKINDPTGYIDSSEMWSPVLSIEKVLISVINVLCEPNFASPANVDAAKMYNLNQEEYMMKARSISQRYI